MPDLDMMATLPGNQEKTIVARDVDLAQGATAYEAFVASLSQVVPRLLSWKNPTAQRDFGMA